jgi:ligand-binding SRPBCC domain-containing protein
MGTELSTMLHFQKSSWIQAPLERVWQFHAHNPQPLIPPWQPVQMIRQPAGIEMGAITEYRLWHNFCDKRF